MGTLFKGKVALITGAAAGIGRSTAFAFADEGAKVIVSDVDTNGGEETVDMIEEQGGEAQFIACDVSETAQVEDLIAGTIDAYGQLDFAFNNAGIEGEKAPTADCTEENWQRVININLSGVWRCMKAEIPHMLEQGGGAIVNCASVAGLIGFNTLPAYVSSKHGIIGLTKTAALEYAEQNIRINAVCPGPIQTEMIDRIIEENEDMKSNLIQGVPMKRFGTPEEIAEIVTWLCSQKSNYITGHALPADGGWVAQ